MYYSTLTCYKQDKLVLLLEVNKRKMHRFFLVTKFFSVHLPTGLRRPFCRVEDYLKPCSSTDKSCLSTIKSRISRQSQKSCQNQRIKKSLKQSWMEGKAWQICFCRTLSLHLGAKEGAPQNPRPSFRTLLGPKQSWIGKHTGETS